MHHLTYNQKLDELKASIYNSSQSLMKELSFDIDDILLTCYFNKIACNSSHFTRFTSYDRGNCFMFNFVATNARTSSHTGQYYGLKLELFAGFDSKWIYFQQKKSVLVPWPWPFRLTYSYLCKNTLERFRTSRNALKRAFF